MPPSATDIHVLLDQHQEHPSAVIATVSGAERSLARELLALDGFERVDEATMVLARIDHEEPYYAGQASLGLQRDGITVTITPGLQDAIDTEWTWANHPMPWLNRSQLRDASNDAQKIYDDIRRGRLTIHAHAHDGWTTLAVGTYRNGHSVRLHGEDHVRVVTDVFDSADEAITAFEEQNGDAVRPGPAPSTDCETQTAKALALTALGVPALTPAAPATTSAPAPSTEQVPVYAAGAGDHEELLRTFLDTHTDWERYRTGPDYLTIANRECLTLRAQFDHEAHSTAPAWTFAGYSSPVGARTWHATATATTPFEIVRTLLNSLAAGPDDTNPEPEERLRTGSPVTEESIAEAVRPLGDVGWDQTATGRSIRWSAPDHLAGVEFDAFAAQSPADGPRTWTLWGGDSAEHPAWAIRLSPHAPASLIQDLTAELAHNFATRPATAASPTRSARPAVHPLLPRPSPQRAPGPGRR